MTSKEILEEFSQINFKENATEKDKIDVIENSDLNVTKILSQNTLKKSLTHQKEVRCNQYKNSFLFSNKKPIII